MPSLPRLLAGLVTGAALFGATLANASVAQANVNFTLTSDTGVVFTSLNTEDLDVTCTGGYANGLFGYKYPGLFPSTYVGVGLTGTASVSGCTTPWYFASEVGVIDGTLSPFNVTGGQGFFSFAAAYVPSQSLALAQCFMGNPATAEQYGITALADYMSVAVDGTNCTVSWLPGVTALPKVKGGATVRMAATKSDHLHTRFISNVAQVGKRTVRIPLQVFGGPKAQASATHVTERITLTSDTGRVIAQGKVKARVGKPVTVRLPLVVARNMLGSDGSTTVRASIERFSKHRGTGHEVKALTLNLGEPVAMAYGVPLR